jgi:hypothetical protein
MINRHVYAGKGARAVLLLDRTGWHTTTNLYVPGNIAPIFLPIRAIELSPAVPFRCSVDFPRLRAYALLHES